MAERPVPEAAPPEAPFEPGDAAIRAVLDQYRAWSGRAVPPSAPPLNAALARQMAAKPWPYASGDARQAATILAGLSFALGLSQARRGHRILEMGASQGALSFLMARLGCATTLQAEDPTEAEALRHQAREGGLAVRVIDGPLAGVDGRFDFVLSHGGLRLRPDHRALLAHARDALLAPGGRLLLVGEALTEDRPSPWGLDTAPEAMEGMRRGGALALSFRPSYLLRTLAALGFNATLSTCPYSPFGNTILAGRCRQPRRDAAPGLAAATQG
jgi:SAM-dependent methyltransferase